jgi:hypothetical protein
MRGVVGIWTKTLHAFAPRARAERNTKENVRWLMAAEYSALFCRATRDRFSGRTEDVA